MNRALATIVLLGLLSACGGQAVLEAPASGTSTPATTSAPAAESPTEAESATASSLAGLPTQDELEAKPSLEGPFPEIDAVTAELGKPALTGTVQRLQFRFDPRPLSKTQSCDTLDVVRLPTGAAVLSGSVYTGDECRSVKGTTAKLREALVALGAQPQEGLAGLGWMVDEVCGEPFDAVVGALEKTLGKPAERGEVPLAGWRYLGSDETCKLLLVTKHLGTGAGEAIWGMRCE